MQAASQQMYSQAGGAQQPGQDFNAGGAQGNAGQQNNGGNQGDNIQDADFEEVK